MMVTRLWRPEELFRKKRVGRGEVRAGVKAVVKWEETICFEVNWG
jgi:hypothetical protein